VESVRGVQGEWLARAGAGGGAAAPILMLNKNLAWISFSTFSQALKTRGEVVATVKLDQRVGRMLERSMRWFVEFQKSFRYLEIEKEFDACFDQIGI
jgi:hypothetical protein